MKYGKYVLNEKEAAALESIKTVIKAHMLTSDEEQSVLKVLQSHLSRKVQREKGRMETAIKQRA